MDKQTIGVFEAKTHLSSLIERVGRGHVFVITRHGRAVAELRPVQAEVPRARRGSAGSDDFYLSADFDDPLEDFAEYS